MMATYSVHYDKYCMGNFTISCDEKGEILPFDKLGAFESYILSMWGDGYVVTLKMCDETSDEPHFVLLFPDGSESEMWYSRTSGYRVVPLKGAGAGRLGYLTEYLCEGTYRGVIGYEEFDEEENLFLGSASTEGGSLSYSGRSLAEAKQDFYRVVDEYLNQIFK